MMLSRNDKEELSIADSFDRITKKQGLTTSLVTYYPQLEVLNCGLCFTYALSSVMEDFNLILNIKTSTRKQTPSNTNPYYKDVLSYAEFGPDLKLYIFSIVDFLGECQFIQAKLDNKEKSKQLQYDSKDLLKEGPDGLMDLVSVELLDALWELNLIEEIKDEDLLS